MALIAMVVYCTEENKKDDCFEKALLSLNRTVDFRKNRLVLSVNGATDRTLRIIENNHAIIESVIINLSNIGTAGALNKVIKLRQPKENVIKIDDDIVVKQKFWVETMQEAIDIDNSIGIIGLKRKDCIQTPDNENPDFKSELALLPHIPGHRWITIEKSYDIMGSCTMFNHLLLDKIGYSRQPGTYGFEDNLMCHRSRIAGFYNCFLNSIEIDHIDEGKTPFQKWKEQHSSELFPEYHRLVHAMMNGEESIYYNPYA